MAQLVEHILGKDEVPGSNPGISLRSTPVVRKYDRGISFSEQKSEAFSDQKSEVRNQKWHGNTTQLERFARNVL